MRTHVIRDKNIHPFILNTANAMRDRITAQQVEDIEKLYNQALKDVQKELKLLKNLQNASASLQRARLTQLQKILNRNLNELQGQMKALIEGNMNKVSRAVVDSTKEWLEKAGLKATTAFASVPQDVVRNLSTGKVYEGDWNLSKAIWSNSKKAQHDIQQIIARDVAENKSTYEIAQDLEKYVDPKAAKSWEWNKVYPGTAAKIDYNAQRLARTMVSHAYSQSTIITSKQNPFCEGIKWHSADSIRTCDICKARNDQVFAINDCPLDHPNGLCTLEPYVPASFDEMADRIGAWMNGKSDSELDNYADSLGYTENPTNASKFSMKQVSDDWFEFEKASAMKEYIQNGKMSADTGTGTKWTSQQMSDLQTEARIMQQAAQSHQTPYKKLYRGAVFDGDAMDARAYYSDKKDFVFDSITSSATDPKVAGIYANPENTNPDGIGVIYEIENPKGVIGYDRDGTEVVIPKGATYKVTRTFIGKDGKLHVSLYANVKLK